jgi:hypothetical protein
VGDGSLLPCASFELTSPWLSIGSAFVLTDLEVILLVGFAIWIARQVVLTELPNWRTPLTLPISLLVIALLVTSFFAPSENLQAFKVSARWSVGVVFFFMLVNAMESGLPPHFLIRSNVLGGLIVAVIALFEVTGNSTVLALIKSFRVEPIFQVGGEVRVAATLGYPTIAAMYLEIIFFFVVGWLALEWSARHWARRALLIGAVLLISEALILTLTRGALLAVAGALVFILLVRVRSGLDTFARAALGAGIVMVVLLVRRSSHIQLLNCVYH